MWEYLPKIFSSLAAWICCILFWITALDDSGVCCFFYGREFALVHKSLHGWNSWNSLNSTACLDIFIAHVKCAWVWWLGDCLVLWQSRMRLKFWVWLAWIRPDSKIRYLAWTDMTYRRINRSKGSDIEVVQPNVDAKQQIRCRYRYPWMLVDIQAYRVQIQRHWSRLQTITALTIISQDHSFTNFKW
jgi:hypothetical protein